MVGATWAVPTSAFTVWRSNLGLDSGLYGPNTNGALQVTGFHELMLIYAMQCMERLILNGDVFDSIDFRRLKKSHWKVLSLLRKLSDELEIIWLCGNHDGSAEVVSHLLGDYLLQTEWQAVNKRGGLTGTPVQVGAMNAGLGPSDSVTSTMSLRPVIVGVPMGSRSRKSSAWRAT